MVSPRRFALALYRRFTRENAEVVSGGVALFALLAVLPTLTAVVSIYALIADPSRIEAQLSGLDKVLPPAVFHLIVEQLERAARRSSDELGVAVATSLVVAILAARSSASSMLAAIAHVDGTPPRWRGWRRVLVTLAIAVGVIVGALTIIVVVVTLPAIGEALKPSHRIWIQRLRWPVLVPLGLAALSSLYALSTPAQRIRHVLPGAVVATALGLLVSLGLSYYVTEWGSYENLYGAFGASMIVILWFYACSVSVMIGAVFNAELRAIGLAQPPTAAASIALPAQRHD